jgi:hypothetical protein
MEKVALAEASKNDWLLYARLRFVVDESGLPTVSFVEFSL